MTRPVPAPELADRWISRAATATVAGLAGIAGAISYSHMRQLAAVHGDTGWHAHAFPLSVDGVEIVASLVLLADRRAGRKSGWLPWTALTIGTAASPAAKFANADHGVVSRVIAGWPAVALLIAVKLLSGILEHRSVSGPAGTSSHDPAWAPDPARPLASYPRRNGSPPGRRRSPARPAARGRTGIAPADIAALEQAARSVRDELHPGRPPAHPRRPRHPATCRRLTVSATPDSPRS